MLTKGRNGWFYLNKERENKRPYRRGNEESIDSERCRNIGTVRKSRITRRGKKGEMRRGRGIITKEKSGLTCFCGPSIHKKR